MTASGQRERPLVLVADDDADILELIVFRLEQADYDVASASDGAAALALAIERSPDLAILDVMMPELNGYEVTRQIREHEEICRMPIVLLTARVQEADVARGFEAGASDFIKKPFSPKELKERVQSLLGQRSAGDGDGR